MAIEIENLHIARGNNKVISGLNLTAEAGEVIGLVAPNGTGKTTLFSGIAQLIEDSLDKLKLNNVSHNDRIKYNQSFFFLESSDNLYAELNVRNHLELIKTLWKRSISIDDVLNELKMTSYEEKPVNELSLGMKQHLLIAMYIVSDAPVLLFDEPLNALDPSSINIVNRIISQLGKQKKTVIISSHNIFNIQEVCSRVLFLKNGVIAEDTSNLSEVKDVYEKLYE